jgi:hypothetical protein
MAELDRARRLLIKLRQMPNPTPAKLMAEFRRLVAAERRRRASLVRRFFDAGRRVHWLLATLQPRGPLTRRR